MFCFGFDILIHLHINTACTTIRDKILLVVFIFLMNIYYEDRFLNVKGIINVI